MKYVLNETQLAKFQEFMAQKGQKVNIVKTSTDSQLVWNDGPVLQAMKRGAVLLLDEIDQARTSIMALQTIAQGKPYYVKKTNQVVEPQPGFNIVATSNTKGDGDGADMFAGAQIMNNAFIERFAVFLAQDYPDSKTETEILLRLFDTRSAENKAYVKRLIKVAQSTRNALKSGDLEHCLTTRRLAQIVNNYKIFGNERLAFVTAVQRFDKVTADSIIETFDALNAKGD